MKPVDLSVLIDSGIDCMDPEYGICLIESKYYVNDPEKAIVWDHVKPRMDYWFSEKNFEYPGELVWALGNAGFAVEESHDASDFQITGLLPGYCWPWELEGNNETD